jgi:hypothetical protein
MTVLFNLSISSANQPAVWKAANIIPILKPGKPSNISTSYRPISLLSPVVKILERLLLPSVSIGLPRSRSQHGFTPFRSTVTALLPIVTHVDNGFIQAKPPTHTAVVALDISKAFDGFNHTLLLKQISESALHSNIIRWLATYLQRCMASCIYQSAKSPPMIIRSGTPQGAVLSPCIYNHFVSDYPEFPEPKAVAEFYADDFSNGRSSPDVPMLSAALTNDLICLPE